MLDYITRIPIKLLPTANIIIYLVKPITTSDASPVKVAGVGVLVDVTTLEFVTFGFVTLIPPTGAQRA